MNSGPFLHPPIKIIYNSLNPCLLKHDFRNPHSICFSITCFTFADSPPWKVSLVNIVPFQQRCPYFCNRIFSKLNVFYVADSKPCFGFGFGFHGACVSSSFLGFGDGVCNGGSGIVLLHGLLELFVRVENKGRVSVCLSSHSSGVFELVYEILGDFENLTFYFIREKNVWIVPEVSSFFTYSP
ncbi:hypothetical protein Hanom_Chr12g01144991 [Helianthus anomalus]